MHAAALLAEALDLARQLHYCIREEDLDGVGGGHCSYGGKKWLLLDVTQSAREQLADAIDALRDEPAAFGCRLSPPLAQLLRQTKNAA